MYKYQYALYIALYIISHIHSVAGATKANYIQQLLYNYNKRHFGLLL